MPQFPAWARRFIVQVQVRAFDFQDGLQRRDFPD